MAARARDGLRAVSLIALAGAYSLAFGGDRDLAATARLRRAELEAFKRRSPLTGTVPVQRLFEGRERAARMPGGARGPRAPLLALPVGAAHAGKFGTVSAQSLPGGINGWTSLGPGNIGGRTRSLLVGGGQVMYAGAVSGGVWKSIDGGNSWRPLDDFMANLAVTTLAQDPASPSVIYAGTGEFLFVPGRDTNTVKTAVGVRGAGIFRTADGGTSWGQLPSTTGPDFNFVAKVVVSPARSTTLYAATNVGLFVSANSGASWTKPLTGAITDIVALKDGQSDTVFCYDSGVGLYRSVAGGPFTTAGAGVPGADAGALAVSSNRDHYYLSLSSSFNGSANAFYFSTDGLQWTSRPVPDFGDQGGYSMALAIDPVEPNRVWRGGLDLYRSDDAGRSWVQITCWSCFGMANYVHADNHGLVFDPGYDGAANQKMYVANDGGIFVTSNAASAGATSTPLSVVFAALDNGYGATQFYGGAVSPGGQEYLGGTQDNGTLEFKASSASHDWTSVLGGDGGFCAVDGRDPNTFYAENYGLSLQKTQDGGLTFADATSGIQDSGMFFIVPYSMDPADPSRLWIGGTYLWRTTNGGGQWVDADLNGLVTPCKGISACGIAPGGKGNVVYAGTADGRVFVSKDALASAPVWKDVTTAPLPAHAFVSWLAVDAGDSSIAYATFSNFELPAQVYRTSDAGASWKAIQGSGTAAIPNIPCHTIVVHPYARNRLYVGTDLGVFASNDSGASWNNVNGPGLANVVVESLAYQMATGRLLAFTYGRGAFMAETGFEGAPAVTAVSPAFHDAGTAVSVTISGFNLDTTTSVFLADSHGTALTSLRRVSSTTLTAVVPPSVLPGSYDLRVSNPVATNLTSYSKYGVSIPDVHPSTASATTTADTLSLAPGAVMTGAIGAPGRVDYLRVTLQGGMAYSVATDPTTGTLGSPSLALLASDGGTPLAIGGPSDLFGAASLFFSPFTTGTYYVTVQGDGSTFGSYALRAYAADHPARPQDTSEPRDDLTAGQKVTAALEAPGDLDCFSVLLAQGSTYTVNVTAGTLRGWQVRLVDGFDIVQARTVNGPLRVPPGLSGRYFVQVAALDGRATGSYSIALVGPLPPDIASVSVQIQTSGPISLPGSLPYRGTISNVTATPVSTFSVQYALTTTPGGPMLNAGAPRIVTHLAGLQTLVLTGSLTLFDSIPQGTYYLEQIVNPDQAIVESNTANDTTTSETSVVLRHLPDLVPYSLGPMFATVASTATTFFAFVYDQSDADDTQPFDVAFRIATLAVPPVPIVTLGYAHVPALAARTSTAAQVVLAVTVPAGNYTLEALVDPNAAVLQSDRSNALVTGPLQVFAPARDPFEPNGSPPGKRLATGLYHLSLSSANDQDFFQFPVATGETLTVRVETTAGAHSSFEVKSADGSWLAPVFGASPRREGVTWTSWVTGTATLRVFPYGGAANYDLELSRTSGPVSVSVTSFAATTATIVPPGHVAGRYVVQTTVGPSGSSVPSGAPATFPVFFETRASLGSDPTPVGNTFGILYSGSFSRGTTAATFTFDTDLPFSFVPGSYFLLAQADPSSFIGEPAATNRVAARSLSIGGLPVLGAPDVQAVAVTHATVAGSGGQTLVATATYTAAGYPLGTNTVVGFHLGTDPRVRSTDYFLASVTSALPSSGATGTATASFVLPQDLAPGLYHLGAIFNEDGGLQEATRSNDTAVDPNTVAVGQQLSLARHLDLIGLPVDPSTTAHAYDASDLLRDSRAAAVVRVLPGGRFDTYLPGKTSPFVLEGNQGYFVLGSAIQSSFGFRGHEWEPSSRSVSLAAGLDLIAYPPPIPAGAGLENLRARCGSGYVVELEADGRPSLYLPSLTSDRPLLPGRGYLVSPPRATALTLPAAQ